MRWLNKTFHLLGIRRVFLDIEILEEMLAMIVAYRATLTTYLEPNEVMVWDSDAKTLQVVTRH